MKVQKLSYVFLLACSLTGKAEALADRFWDGDIFFDSFFQNRSSTISSIVRRDNMLVLKFAMPYKAVPAKKEREIKIK